MIVSLINTIANPPPFQGGIKAEIGYIIPLIKGDEIFGINISDNRALFESCIDLRWGFGSKSPT